MARKINFRSRVAESLEAGDASTFQTLIKNRLTSKLNEQKIDIISEIVSDKDAESQIVNQLAATASSFGGNDVVYDMGVMDISFDNAEAVKHFTEQLDGVEGVDYYEINGPKISGSEDHTGATDLEYQGNREVYEVVIYLDLDGVSLPTDVEGYMGELENFEEACKGKKKKVVSEKACEPSDEEDDESSDEEDSENDEEDEEDDETSDEEDLENMKESLDFTTIVDNVALQEFLTIKTAHWNQALKKDVVATQKVCPPGRTGADCKTVLTAQQKMELRKRMSMHLKKMSKARRSKMASHAHSTQAFIKQHNLMSKSAAKAKM